MNCKPIGLPRPQSGRNRRFRAASAFTGAAAMLCAALAAQAQVNVTTYHNDNARLGVNAAETILTPANVAAAKFGKLFSRPVDGHIYAQPLYLSGLTVNGKTRNVVFVATQHDSVYAFDADDNTDDSAAPLWTTSFLTGPFGVTVTTPTASDVSSADVQPEIGITGTPVIDPDAGILYVVAKTKETDATGYVTYAQRLHALSVSTGQEMPGSPVLIQAAALGTGDPNPINPAEYTDGKGHILFSPLREFQRCALLLSNGVVYVSWASHGDALPYHGWIIGYRYDGTQLAQTTVWNAAPNGAAAGFWMSGGGPAADADGSLYAISGNGDFDPTKGNFGDSFIKLTPGPITVMDYFTPFNQKNLSDHDTDLGSGGVLLLPDKADGIHAHLLVGAGKEGNLYIVDRDDMGQYSTTQDNVVLSLPKAVGGGVAGSFGTPAFFNDTLYYGGTGDFLRAFAFKQGANLNYASGFAGAADFAFNQNAGNRQIVQGSVLRLTDDNYNQAASVYAKEKVNVSQFSTSFQFQLTTKHGVLGEGIVFTLQNSSLGALGWNGSYLGYAAVGSQAISPSIGVKFDPTDDPGELPNTTGLLINGALPTPANTVNLAGTGIDLNSGHPFQADLDYASGTLTVKITDLTTAAVATQTYGVDIPATVGSTFAYAGFTASTGGATGTQDVLNWTYRSDSSDSTLLLTGASANAYAWPGMTPAISANGTRNGILWTLEIGSWQPKKPAILHAYLAADLTKELYNSGQQADRDTAGTGVKFSVPTIANGKVFVGTQTELTVYGLRDHARPIISIAGATIRKTDDGYTASITLTNSGGLGADNLTLNTGQLGAAAPDSTVPIAVGTLPAGAATTITMTFPASAGASGTSTRLAVYGAWSSSAANQGSVSCSFRVTLP